MFATMMTAAPMCIASLYLNRNPISITVKAVAEMRYSQSRIRADTCKETADTARQNRQKGGRPPGVPFAVGLTVNAVCLRTARVEQPVCYATPSIAFGSELAAGLAVDSIWNFNDS